MADNTKQLSNVTIIDSDGKTTSAHFAADINNFIVYDNNGAENSVKDCVFGATNPGTFKPIKDTAGNITTDNSMWSKLDTKAQECYDILDKNKNFWNGLSTDSYQEPKAKVETVSKYLATGDQINQINFYGSDAITNPDILIEAQRPYPKDKLVTIGALEDFAKRIPTMGGLNHSLNEGSIAVGEYATDMPSGAAANSIAWNGLAQGAKSTAIHGMAYGSNGVAIHGIAGGANSIALGPDVYVGMDNGVGIGSNLNVDQSAVVLGRYNESLEKDREKERDIRFAVGVGTQKEAKTGLKLTVNNAYYTSGFRPTLYTDAFNAHGEWVATCAWSSGTLDQSGMNSFTIDQPLELWTKAMVCLNGVDASNSILTSQSIIIMPKDMRQPGNGVIWHSNRIDSNSTPAINVKSVSYDASSKEIAITLTLNVGQMTNIYYACELTGMAM